MKYGDLLTFRNKKGDKEKKIKTVSWSDKLVNPSNYWLKAVNKEEEKEYDIAAESYLKDAMTSFGRGSLNRAALSCSCAALCMSKLGDRRTAQSLFFEAGTLFETKANTVSEESIRDSVWALRQSYENFVMSGNLKKAEEIHETIIFYAKRINPFSGPEEIRRMRDVTETILDNVKYDSVESKEILRTKTSLYATIQDFMTIRSESVKNVLAK
jgi:hypothetical protein